MEHRTEIRPDPWAHALESLRAGHRTVLVKVVDHSGSVPGVTGTMAVVSELGIAGTIGGGAAEQQLLERAHDHREGAEVIRFRHTPSEGGTLCSGLQVFAVYRLTEDDEESLQAIVDTLADHRNGTLHLDPGGLTFETGTVGATTFTEGDEGWSFTEPLGLLDTLTIIGGGHVSLAFARVMATLPFRIVILDNRPQLPTMEANIYAHERRVVDYEEVAEHVPAGDRSWVVIMTYGHIHDRKVLGNLVGRDYAYIGVLGSRAKIHSMFDHMKKEGVPPESLERVHAPVGLSIRSHTPEEIAISIAGEIISVRNR
ncbi:MAG: XdhC family protein [Thermoanaerobaculales bacterium]|nr:XdhC family protein [Thermoanaerobaculales bacterium]